MKKIFFSLIYIIFATNVAQSAELSNPFYLSPKGNLTSTTQLSFQKTHTRKEIYGNNFRTRNKYFEQRLEYGISEKVAIIGTIANTWKRNRLDTGLLTDKTDTNVDWSAGAVYDFYNKDDAHLQMELVYLQKETHHFGGAYKALYANARTGYDLKYFLPYIGGQIELPIAQRKDADNDLKYDAYAGFYKSFFDVIAADMTLHYNYNHFFKSTGLDGRADLSLLLGENIAIGGFFNYSFFNRAQNHAHTDAHTIGATVKIQF
ncbi:MAG: hypothetical protein J6Y03_02510 [Alphaproteobacteria bacterium]|nr:hypothetical protein [Alphaproteobacteria bacterium]